MAGVMEASFTADIQAPGAARRVLATLATDLGDDLLERSGLALTEVVANSVEHAGLTQTDEIHLHVSLCPELLRIEVLDDGPGFIAAPVASKPDKAPHGWGLYVVDRLTDRWGVDCSHSTRVWLEFDRDAVGAANRSAA
jgi:anti-sigma regulatory factor (Ser/Thr protein kinase)